MIVDDAGHDISAEAVQRAWQAGKLAALGVIFRYQAELPNVLPNKHGGKFVKLMLANQLAAIKHDILALRQGDKAPEPIAFTDEEVAEMRALDDTIKARADEQRARYA